MELLAEWFHSSSAPVPYCHSPRTILAICDGHFMKWSILLPFLTQAQGHMRTRVTLLSGGRTRTRIHRLCCHHEDKSPWSSVNQNRNQGTSIKVFYWLTSCRHSLPLGLLAIPLLSLGCLLGSSFGVFFLLLLFFFCPLSSFEDVFDSVQLDCLLLGWLSRLRAQARVSAHCVIIVDYVIERGLCVSLFACLASFQAICLHLPWNKGNDNEAQSATHF